jgi:protein-disulfide isomerase
MAAAQQGKFWEMHDLLFANQRDLGRDSLLRAALQLNLDLPRFEKDLEDQSLQAAVEADVREGTRLGVEGTPTMFLNGQPIVGIRSKAAFESLFKDQFHLVAQAPSVEASGATVAARASNATAQPAQTLTLLWFSDLESPLTPAAYDLVHKAMELYPEKIRLVFKNAPLTFHGEAFLAHVGLLAAGAQGKFWPMHDVLLANQTALRREDLLRYASQIGLDTKRFQADLDGKTYEDAVRADLEEARVREVRGTPTFFINGTRADGLMSFPRLQEMLEAEFHRVTVSASESKRVQDAN